MNALTKRDYAADRKALIDGAGLTLSAVFVPQSKSRHALIANRTGKPGDGKGPYFYNRGGYDSKGAPCINWRVTLERNGTPIWSGDYTQGAGHLPGKRNYGQQSVDEREAEIKSCEIGRSVKSGFMPGASLKPPTLTDVLSSLLLDGTADSMSFEDWAANFGYDADSRTAEKTFDECAAIGKALRLGLGAELVEQLREAFQDY
jgi:hypothetical protein